MFDFEVDVAESPDVTRIGDPRVVSCQLAVGRAGGASVVSWQSAVGSFQSETAEGGELRAEWVNPAFRRRIQSFWITGRRAESLGC